MRVYSFTSHLEECCQGKVLMPVNEYRKWDDACRHDFLCNWTTAPCLAGRERHRSKPQQHPGGPHAVQRFILEVKHCTTLPILMLCSPCGLCVRASSERKSRSIRAVRCAFAASVEMETSPPSPRCPVSLLLLFLPGLTQRVCLFSVIGIALKVSGHP